MAGLEQAGPLSFTRSYCYALDPAFCFWEQCATDQRGIRPPSRPAKDNQPSINHDLDSPYYDATHPEEYFAAAAEAEASGYRVPKR